MLDTNDLRRLAEMDTHPHPTLSLYLDLGQSREARLLSLGQMFKRKEQQLAGDGQAPALKFLGQEQERVTRYVEELPTGPHRGLALFACQPRDLFNAYTFPLNLPDRLELDPNPYIRPLLALAQDHCRALIVLLDQRRARFFVSYHGELRELESSRLENPALNLARDGSQDRAGDNQVARKNEEGLSHYYKQVNQTLMDLMRGQDCRELLLGGSKTRLEHFAPQLHPYLAQRLAGSFNLDPGASLAAVAEQAQAAQAQARRRRQDRLLENLADNLGPNGQAATGLNQVLASLYENQVHTLLVRRGFTAPGGACPACGRLRHVGGPCPICGQAMHPVADIVNLALARALDSGAEVEQVEGASALDELGGIAALLRYA